MDYFDLIISARYKLIDEIIEKCLKRVSKPKTISDLLDTVLLDKYLGIPIFLALMWAVFQFAFKVSAPFSDTIDMFFSIASEWVKSNIKNEMLASLVGDGIFGGLGFILSFLPPLFFIFIALSLLEDSGYLPRAAFVMDRILTRVGLHGKSFIPMLLGFGCNVPAIMACRTIENEIDRKITIMINPLMSCSARLPIYVLFAGTFFPGYEGAVILCIYLLGLVLAAIMAKIFRKIIFGGEPSPLLIELPDYTIPSARSVIMNAWVRVKIFLKKASTILFIGAIIIWFLSVFPWDATKGGKLLEKSYAAMIGHAIEPIIVPLGFDWKVGVALFTGFVAKELVVGTLGILYGVGVKEKEIMNVIAHNFNQVTALALMAMTLIYLPCLATLGVLIRELGSLKLAFVVVAYELILAYLVAVVIVGIGHMVM